MEAIKVILVDDQTLYRNTFKELLRKIANVQIVAEASNGYEFLNLIIDNKPDIVFMDIEMPRLNGIDTTKIALELYSDLIIIGLSLYDSSEYINQMLKAGAKGYLLKTSDNVEILERLLKYSPDEIFLSKDITRTSNQKKNIKILIIDDYEISNYIVGHELQKIGYQVKKAVSAKEAMIYLQDNNFDLIITDYNMPEINGIELTKMIRKLHNYRQTPVLMLTATTDKEVMDLANEAGINGWLKKPFETHEAASIIDNVLRNSDE